MNKFYTMADIARLLKKPATTLKSRRDTFVEFIPTTGHGRDKRYLPEALSVMRIINKCCDDDMSTEQIKEHLAAIYPINVSSTTTDDDAQDRQERGLAVPDEQSITTQQLVAILALYAQNQTALTSELSEIKQKLSDLQEQVIATRDDDARRLEDRDKVILTEIRARMDEQKVLLSRSWWQRLWAKIKPR